VSLANAWFIVASGENSTSGGTHFDASITFNIRMMGRIYMHSIFFAESDIYSSYKKRSVRAGKTPFWAQKQELRRTP
jgi:hypothetical protein